PNGGIISEDEKFKIELLINPSMIQDQLVFYLYKNGFKGIPNAGITGYVKFIKKNGEEFDRKLKSRGDNRFVAQLKGTESFNCQVIFTLKKGKEISGTFSFVGDEPEGSSRYYCAMHPKKNQDKLGLCSECGMELKLRELK
ncbi:MAG: hypothetical protein HRT72_02345, partial [Flavobacteriales bacterium]|nr:hypothetical protein [Flavobacteriales bacterium]